MFIIGCLWLKLDGDSHHLLGNLKFEVSFLTMWVDGKLRDSKVRFLQDRTAILPTSHQGDYLTYG